jgi:hypothetical protein
MVNVEMYVHHQSQSEFLIIDEESEKNSKHSFNLNSKHKRHCAEKKIAKG